MALSFATDHWVETMIQRADLKAQAAKDSNVALQNELKENSLYFTRYRGMFRTCYPGNETICKYICFNSKQLCGYMQTYLTVGWLAMVLDQ